MKKLLILLLLPLCLNAQTYEKAGLEDLQWGESKFDRSSRVTPGTTVELTGFTPINVMAFGALGDGVTDDFAAIQAVVDTCAANNGGVVYMPPGTFLISEAITIDSDNISIIGSGMNATIIQASSTGYHGIVVSGADYVTIRDLAVKDFIDVGAGEVHGIRVEDSDYVTVERCYADNCDDAGIRISYLNGGDRSRHGRVVGNVVLNTPEGAGIEVLGADSLIVQGNTVKNCSGNGIRITGSVNSIISENNIFCAGTSQIGIVVSQADLAGDLEDSYDVSVIDNHISGTFGTGINLNVHVHDIIVRGNIIKHDGVTGYGIRAYDAGLSRTWDWYDIDIVGNKISGTSNGIFLSDDGERARIFDNKIDGAETAIYVLAAAGDTINNVEIRRNQIINTSASKNGIRIDGTPDVSIYDNDYEMAATTSRVVSTNDGGIWGLFDVTRFGATGDGVTDDTDAIQAAIDAREAIGGGEVDFPYSENEYFIATPPITITDVDVVLTGPSIPSRINAGGPRILSGQITPVDNTWAPLGSMYMYADADSTLMVKADADSTDGWIFAPLSPTEMYGSMYQHSGSETITLTAANVDSIITGWSTGEVNDITFGAASRALVINTAGTYLITWAANLIGVGTGTNVYEVCVGINGTRNVQSCGHASTDNLTEDRTVGGVMIYTASIDDLIQLTVRNTIDGDDVDINNTSLTVVRIN